jgi:hypothetical protein
MRRVERASLNRVVTQFTAMSRCLCYERITLHPLSKRPDGLGFVIETGRFQPVPLRSRPSLWLTAAQQIDWRERQSDTDRPGFHIAGYTYRIGQGEEGRDELLAYHWDPYSSASGSSEPHVHIGASAFRPVQAGRLRHFHKRHIPTGHVTFPTVVRFLIEELGVEPVNPNWERILTEADQP